MITALTKLYNKSTCILLKDIPGQNRKCGSVQSQEALKKEIISWINELSVLYYQTLSLGQHLEKLSDFVHFSNANIRVFSWLLTTYNLS